MNQPRRSGLIDPGEDPLQLVRQARHRRGLSGLLSGGLSLSTLFYIGAALVFAYYLWWQFGPKPQVAAAQGPASTATATPSPSSSPTATPTSSATVTATPTGTTPARPTSVVPTHRAEVTRLVAATVMVEVTRLVSTGGGGTRTVEVTRLVPATVEVVITAPPEPTEPPVVLVVTATPTSTETPTPTATLEQPTPDPRLTAHVWLPLILR